MAPVMKKKAVKKTTAKKQKAEEKKIKEDEEESSSADEEASESSSADEEAEKSSSDNEEEQDEVKDDDKQKAGKDPSAIKKAAGDAKRDVGRVQRVIDKLLRQQGELAKKMKENKDAMRKAEKELEPLKAVLANKRRAVNKIKNEKLAIIEEKKAARMSRFRKSNNKRLKSAKKRVNAMNAGMRGVKGKAEDAKQVLSRAQSKVDEIMRNIKALKDKGEKVPEDLKNDFSSPHAWKPPGYLAAKALMQAKEVLSKAQAEYKKAYGTFEQKDLKRKATLSSLDEINKKRKEGNSGSRESVSAVATPTRSVPEAKSAKLSAGKKKRKSGR